MSDYVPQRGDLIWIDFDPQVGREQRGRRPALVLSPKQYNAKSSLALICPVTSKAKGYPFEVELPTGLEVEGVILADQLRSLDYHGRRARFISRLPVEKCQEVLGRAKALLN
jgi:mRNA interferase MazF